MSSILLLFKLLIGHALADYPLQGDFIGKFKSPRVASPCPPAKIWWQLLTAHALIHAGAVWVVTGRPELAAVELVAHWLIDYAKCMGKIGFHMDQWLHCAFKLGYAFPLHLL